MGIPKFFRFISERWPLISQKIEGDKIAEFDNLYLDMNSILHNCTHSNDDSLSRFTEEQMFGAIFAYIDHLFDTIKPKKTFYMAIDGVAPRAKMNQQRARRFRSAKDAEENLKKAIANGSEIPKDPAFDSNAITPGTEFMAKLTQHLKYYINQKVSSDTNWQNVEVILSGHEVPGEGEHKIMAFIRNKKSQDGYDPNTRHCIYGLDADLIMLGLVAHEPHFAILREEVTFGRKSSNQHSNDLTKTNFFLLYVSLVREYLQLEFSELADQITFEYDFEKVLDDFILIMFVIGNDFLPNLPDLHLNKGAFPLLIETFKQAMRDSDGYLNDEGTINFRRLGIWLEFISVFEYENFEKGEVDIEWFNKQLDNISHRGVKKREQQGKVLLVKQQRKLVGLIREWILRVYAKPLNFQEMQQDESKIPSLVLPSEMFESEYNFDFIRQFAFRLGIVIIHSKSKGTYTARIDIDGVDANETTEEFDSRVGDVKRTIKQYQAAIIVDDEEILEGQRDLYNDKFVNWKNQYYKKKLNFTLDEEDKIIDLTQNYLEGLQWVLNYYYKGNCSWHWFYRYHYSPRISDVSKGINNLKIDFELGQPFKPFEQLMAVLPERSKNLIPQAYRVLMTDPHSPIADFYPDDCEVDMNGKTASWEAVVLLSFVDEKRLQEALIPYDSALTPEQKQRNKFGNDLLFHFNPQVKTVIKSPLPAFFADFQSHCIESTYTLPKVEKLLMGLCDGAKFGKEALAGFPTLYNVPFTHNLKLASVTVFENPSRSETMILSVENQYSGLSVEQFAKEYVGKVVYVNWPYLAEARVVKVHDSLMSYKQDIYSKSPKVFSSPLENFEISSFREESQSIARTQYSKKGVYLGNEKSAVEGIAYVQFVNGLVRTREGAYVKSFEDEIHAFPTQLIVDTVVNADERFMERDPVSISEEYPTGSDVVFLGSFAYGTPAKVIAHDSPNTLSLKISKVSSASEPNFGSARAKLEKQALTYHNPRDVAQMLKINPLFLSRITSSYMIEGVNNKRHNIGLELKFEAKKLKVLGYTKRNVRFWEYSDLAILLIREYLTKFPEVFKVLMAHQGNKYPEASVMFKTKDASVLNAKILELTQFLKAKKANLTPVTLDTESLTKGGIAEVESKIIDYLMKPHEVSNKGVKNIPREAILDASKSFLMLRKQSFELGDRVAYVLDSGKVPLYSKGTVVGIRVLNDVVSLQVVFDQPMLTGNNFDGRLSTQRGMTVHSSTVLNLTNKQYIYHSKASSQVSQKGGAAYLKQQKILQQRKEAAQKKIEQQEKKERSQKELLSVIKGGETKKPIEEPSKSIPNPASDSNGAAKNIFGAVLGNVMGAPPHASHIPQQPQQQFNGGVPPPMPFMYGGIPITTPDSALLMNMLQAPPNFPIAPNYIPPMYGFPGGQGPPPPPPSQPQAAHPQGQQQHQTQAQGQGASHEQKPKSKPKPKPKAKEQGKNGNKPSGKPRKNVAGKNGEKVASTPVSTTV